MNKIKKLKLLEFLIFIIILISLIVICILAFSLSKDKIEKSNTNEIQNYSVTKLTKYETTSDKSSQYNLPLNEYINNENSKYEIYIQSTDNTITNYIELFTIKYNEYPEEFKDTIINYCNAYDEIENKYKMICQLKDNTITIKNNYSIDKISTPTIKTKNFEINIPIQHDTKLNIYLKELDNLNINHYEVNNIE